MIEREWLEGSDVQGMAFHAAERASDRKARLLVCGFCRQRWEWFEDPRSRRAVEVAERFADGQASREELADAHREASDARVPTLAHVWETLPPRMGMTAEELRNAFDGIQLVHQHAYHQAWEKKPAQGLWAGMAEAVTRADWHPLGRQLAGRVANTAARLPELAGESVPAVPLLWDLFGNPFRPVFLDRAWLTWAGGTVVHMARLIYEERRFDDLALLGDALEEAGCTDRDVLAHCRGEGLHVRGCWVLDLILGKS
ncbi:MAG: hypothetical protein L0Z62_20445 [Gemmataceae bacterium]|nr:hypothetical protein [Gemmataceae bacterium]